MCFGADAKAQSGDEMRDDFDDAILLVQENRINGKAHEHHVYAVAGNKEETLPFR